MSETYANARARIHTALRQQHGWKSSDAGLKRLWADSPKGYRVLAFCGSLLSSEGSGTEGMSYANS